MTICLHDVKVCNVDISPTQHIVGRRGTEVVDTQMLEDLIASTGKKKTYLAQKIGISVQNLRMKIHNRSDFKSNEVAILCQELGITRLSDKEKIFFKM